MMKRKLFVVLSLLSAFLLTACHGERKVASFEIPESFDTSKNYEITFWAKNDTNKTQTAIYEKAVDDFEALYPNIDVNLRLYTDYSRIYNDVITNIATQTTPNVCITYPDHIATYITGSNVVVPLDSLMNDSRYGFGGSDVKFDSPTYSEVIPEFLDECILYGSHYALPFMRSTEALYINKTYVEKLGYTIPEKVTWDFIWEVSEAALKKDGSGNFAVNGQNIMIPFIYKSTDNMMIQYLKQAGGDYSTPAGDILIFNDKTKEFLQQIATHTSTGAFSTFKISSYPANFLNAGQCIFAIDSTAGSTWMGSNAPLSDIPAESFVDFETVVKAIPQVNVDDPKMISQGPSICIFNKEDNNEVLASWLFAQYLLTNDVQTAYSETEGYVPVTSKAQEDASYIEYLNSAGIDNSLHYDVKIAATKLLLENTGNTFITPVFNGSASLREASGHLIESTAKSIRRKETVDDKYFEKLFSDTTALYHLDQVVKDAGSRAELGPLPSTAKLLLGALAFVWVLIILYIVVMRIKVVRGKSTKNH